MMKTGTLIISNPNIVFRALPIIQSEISNTLYIQYFPSTKWSKNLSLRNKGSAPNWPVYSSSLIKLYSRMLSYRSLDVRVVLSGIRNKDLSKIITNKPIEVVYYDQQFCKEDVQEYVYSCVQNKTSNCEVIALYRETQDSSEEYNNNTVEDQIYDNVVLGGTFDRLHYGHKILLTEAILRCCKKLTVGVTDTGMLHSKKLWELVEPCDYRMQKVKEFLEEVDPSLEYEIVPINDMFGPTKDDPTFQMIVVSSETVRGGSKINEIRTASGLNPLCIHEVELLADVNKEDEEEEDKISSSNLRLRCLGTLLRTPQPKPDIPKSPYVIGLTGGIASGKTNIVKYLEELGAGVVDCDKLGHYVYRVSSPGHAKVVEKFGQGILDESGAIDRKKLGAIVFSDKEKLNELNAVVWPLILEETLIRVQQLHDKGYKIVVIEAAILLVAGWTRVCHEVWVSIIPPGEAVKRVMERNSLTEEQAKSRIASQPTNTEYVKQANVVFCSLWRKEFTQKQATKAWNNLKLRLDIE